MITVLPNQSLFDIAIQEDGNVLATFEWALANGISITKELVAGQKLIAPKAVNRNDEIARYFKSKKQNIATHQRVAHHKLDYAFAYRSEINL